MIGHEEIIAKISVMKSALQIFFGANEALDGI
jgi:hypothetical protein